jgi:REP element-mobilizing transposase RayT
MARVARTSLPDGIYHVVARGVPEMGIFLNDSDRSHFVRLLGHVESRHRWICHAYCLMATHYHLVLAATRVALSNGLCELNGIYARGFNQRHGRFGHLFADRFSSRLIESEEYLHDACSYVLLNPVKAGLCERVEDWPWSHSRIGLSSS